MGLHRCLYLLKRPLLDLADAFAGYSMFRGKFFKRCRLVVQPSRSEDAAFTRVEIRDGVIQGLPVMSGLLFLGQSDFLGRRGVDKPVQRLSGRQDISTAQRRWTAQVKRKCQTLCTRNARRTPCANGLPACRRSRGRNY